MTIFGFDGSDFNSPIDAESMARVGIAWVTYKATEGTGLRHYGLKSTLEAARAAGIPAIGAYHVVRTGDVVAQVHYFLAYLDEAVPWWRTWPHFFLQVDAERWPYDNVSAETIKSFVSLLIVEQPRPVITYASRAQYGDSLYTVPGPLWNANYPTWDNDTRSCPRQDFRESYISSGGDSGRGWTRYSDRLPAMWQFTDNATIGNNVGCDASAFRGTLPELLKMLENLEGSVLTAAQDNALAETWAVNKALRDGTPVPKTATHPGGPAFAVQQIQALTAKLDALTVGLASFATKVDAALDLLRQLADADPRPEAVATLQQLDERLTTLRAQTRADAQELLVDFAQGGADAVRADDTPAT